MTTRPAATRPDGGETLDAFYRGRVRVLQRKKGYRFSVDAPLLADFIRTRKGTRPSRSGPGAASWPCS